MCKRIEYSVISISEITKKYNEFSNIFIKDFITGDADNLFDELISVSCTYIDTFIRNNDCGSTLPVVTNLTCSGDNAVISAMVMGCFYGWLRSVIFDTRLHLTFNDTIYYTTTEVVNGNVVIFTQCKE